MLLSALMRSAPRPYRAGLLHLAATAAPSLSQPQPAGRLATITTIAARALATKNKNKQPPLPANKAKAYSKIRIDPNIIIHNNIRVKVEAGKELAERMRRQQLLDWVKTHVKGQQAPNQ